MARETALWQRCIPAAIALRNSGHLVDLQRLENMVGAGHPDVEGCINGDQVWIELKSCSRPVNASTPIRPKKRNSQNIWHRTRTAAGCRCNWILIQVGEARDAALYLIPGSHYADITVPEAQLAALSVIDSTMTVADILLCAAKGW